MKSFIAWLLICGVCCGDNLFGLGDPKPVAVQVQQVAETFGLDSLTPVPQPLTGGGMEACQAKDGLFSNSVIFPNRKISVNQKPKAEITTDREPIVGRELLPIIRRSQQNWTDPDVGMWTASNLREHLLGEFQSPVHRGSVPFEQLQGRSLSDLIAIHANLHEGWKWDGTSKQQLQVATIKERLTVPQPVTRWLPVQSNCPGGVCPTNHGFRLLRRR